MPKIKSAFEWVDDGVPLPGEDTKKNRARYVRWVAMIQEDAVKCYEVTATIKEVEMAFGEFLAELDLTGALEGGFSERDKSLLKGALGVLKIKMEDLAKLKVPVDEE